MTKFRNFLPIALSLLLAACETSVPSVSSSSVPFQASYRCTDEVSLVVRRSGSGVSVSDSRGFEPTVPASPAGQNIRYAEGIYALILEGRNATWFVSGQTPVECQR
jgi:hypothetical protein